MKLSRESQNITQEGAELLIRVASETARSINLNICVAVVDASGRLKAFAAMDQSPVVSAETAVKKAKTAVGFGLPTGAAWHDFIKNDPILLIGAQQLPDFILLGGGSPVTVNGAMVGAIGVSGGHYSQDEKCVQAALAAFQKAAG